MDGPTAVVPGLIFASVVGTKELDKQDEKTIINVRKGKEPSIVPDVQSVVTARVEIL
jgi:hypothetical protein